MEGREVVKSVVEENFYTLLKDLSADISDLENIVIELRTVENAYKYIVNSQESAKLLQILFNLQTTHSVIIGMHPESPYTEIGKSSSVYEKLITISEENVRFISAALDIYQYITSPTVSPPYLINKEYCHRLLNSPFAGTQWSFRGILQRIIGNSKQLLPYLQHTDVFEYVKGIRSRRRDFGAGTASQIPIPSETQKDWK